MSKLGRKQGYSFNDEADNRSFKVTITYYRHDFFRFNLEGFLDFLKLKRLISSTASSDSAPTHAAISFELVVDFSGFFADYGDGHVCGLGFDAAELDGSLYLSLCRSVKHGFDR